MQCPNCGRENRHNWPRCACGYEFARGQRTSANVQPAAPQRTRPWLWLLEVAAILLLLLNTFMAAGLYADLLPEKRFAHFLGATSGPLIVTLIVVGVATIFPKGRTRRARAILLVITLSVMFIASCNSNVIRMAEVARTRQ